MKISSTRNQNAAKPKSWFYNRERKPGVLSESPADQLRDTISITATTALVGTSAAALTRAMGAGPLAAVALAVPVALAGAVAGGLASGLSQEGVGKLIGAEPGHDAGTGAIAGGAVMSGLVAGASTLAAGFGVDPSTVGLVSGAFSGGALVAAGLAMPD